MTGAKTFRGVLRNERFTKDLTGGVVRLPQVARTIEALAPPVGARLFVRALLVQNQFKFSGGFSIDSFDSSTPAKSTGGQYDVTKKQSHGDIASNSAGGISSLNNCFVWGDASCNTGAMSGTTNVNGNKYNNFSTTIPPVAKPTFSSINGSYSAITNPATAVTLTGGAAGAPQNYKLTDLTISNSAKPLILAPHAAGQESYINIWVTGKTTISGSGFIQQQPGVHVQIWSEGSVTVSGSGWVNQTNTAANLQVYGVTPPSYVQRDMIVSGSGTFVGVFNGGTTFDLTISGGASFIGAAIGREADYSGSGKFHYDETLSNLGSNGAATSYQYASWIEDIR